MKYRALTILFSLAFATTMSCNEPNSPPPHERVLQHQVFRMGELITNEGVYEFPAVKLTLRVVVKKDLVCFSLENQSGAILLKNDRNSSAFQRWALTLDESSRLWFWSSDIGEYVWEKVGQQYVSRLINEDDLPEMPEAFRDALPNSVMKLLRGESK